MPKLGNCLEMYTCAQAVPKLCPSMYTPPVYKEWPNLNTNWALAWALAWAHVYISKQFPSLGHSNFYSIAHAAHIASLYSGVIKVTSYMKVTILPWGWSCKLMLYTRPLCKMITPVGKENGKKPYLNTSDHNTYLAPKILLLLSLW